MDYVIIEGKKRKIIDSELYLFEENIKRLIK